MSNLTEFLQVQRNNHKKFYALERRLTDPNNTSTKGGMSCPANGCDVFLDSMTKCRKHWSEIHTEFVSRYQCSMYRFSTMRRNQTTRHMSRVHPNKPIEGLEPSTFLNKKYKNPGNGFLPICGRQFRD
uniref:Uncharacterized protein n=1 Tax=Magallana gigas TaxID=29159 RepID=K1QIG5_MAGGI